MKYIIKLSPEITIKSKPVRKNAIKILTKNINRHLDKFEGFYNLRYNWERIDLDISNLEDFCQEIEDIVSSIPGIHALVKIIEYDFTDLDSIANISKEYYLDKVENKSFCVRCRRTGVHNFSSIELERYVGERLFLNAKNTSVKLKEPDITVDLFVRDDKLQIVTERIEGIGGYPVGFQEKVLSLISGGFDSGVSSYSLMKRGAELDFLFFNLGGNAHELGVKQISYHLWNRFSKCSKRARFITVNFENVVSEILTKVDHKYRGVVLKRFMLRVASMIAEDHYYALVKGDSLGQVSSQTLKNLYIVDKASNTLVLRPLISMNKQEIVDVSKKIKTYDFSANMPEYCGIISDKPSTGAKLEKVIEEESNIEEKVLIDSFENRKIEFVREMMKNEINSDHALEEKTEISFGDIVIDVRESSKILKKPLKINSDVLEIPFFEINHRFKDLDQSKNYLLYCDKGVISKLHGLYLKEKGFENVGLFR